MKGMKKLKKLSQKMIEIQGKVTRIWESRRSQGWLDRTSFPIPGRVKDLAFLVSETAKAATSSTIAAAVFLESSNFPAK